MTTDLDPRTRHPALSGRPQVPRWWVPAPAFVTAANVAAVLAITVVLVAWRPDLSEGDVALVVPYGLVAAGLVALVTWRVASRQEALQRATAKAMALALEREERLDLIVSSLHDGLIFQDRHLRLCEFNEAAARMLGLTELAIGKRPDELAPWVPVLEDGTELTFDEHPAAVTLRTGQPALGMILGVRLPARAIWVRLNTVPVFDETGEPDGVITTFHDITEERSTRETLASTEAAATVAAEALSWQALHDPLTELPNRAHFVERVTAALDHARHSGATTAVLSLGLDRFKQINDTMGHEAGDHVLLEVAQRLRGVLRAGDVVARLGGDEFIVLAEVLADRSEATFLAERLRDVVSAPIWLPQGNLTLTASVGIAFDVDHRPSTLLRDADTALHKAKEHGRDRSEIFDDSLRAEAIRRAAAEQILRSALDEDGLRVLYQPIVDLATGRVVEVEALLRIVGPHRELLTPASFITIAEETGLIVPIGAGVLDDACAQMRRWQDELGDQAPGRVSVNLAARQLTRLFPAVVEASLERHGIRPEALTFELTETALIEAGRDALSTIEHLHDLGVRFAIDDFGTGYSSLAYLKRFPVDIVKIDRTFTKGLGTQQDDTEIVRAVLALAHSLGLTCVAEGVETAEQLQLLHELGCEHAQGYLLSRPVAAPDLPKTFAGIVAATRSVVRRRPERSFRVVGD
ncbi:MAG TPA: EAL domain-containing protein [Acidimicrobiales bacterium]|nr:EAL domain-containing protein [Acidimicrobiales bacterium]